tara:strand:- start:350 stop:592 length:243 start_codon:yes stop_codon:yes gene_type:complete
LARKQSVKLFNHQIGSNPIVPTKKGDKMNIITQIIIALIIMALMVIVAYLKSQLNIANYNVDMWRQLALTERAKNVKQSN